MKTKIEIIFETDSEDKSIDILTQIGLVMMENARKVSEYEIKHNQED